MGALSTAAPYLWLKADAITGLVDGDPVATWPDSGSGANDATQATGTAKPTYKTAISPTGLPIVRFDGTTDLMSSNASASDVDQTMIVVLKRAATGAAHTIRGGSGNQAMQWRLTTADKQQLILQGSTSVATSTTSIGTSAFVVLAATYSAGMAYSEVTASLTNQNVVNPVDGSTSTFLEAAGTPSVGDPRNLTVRPRTSTVATSYTITPRNTFAARAPKDFLFQGSDDGSSWTTLDTQTGITTWSGTTPITFNSFSNSHAYVYYRLSISATNGSTPLDYTEFQINSLTPSANGSYAFYYNGTADGSGTTTVTTLFDRTTTVGRATSSEFLSGDLAELAVFKRVLTSTELTDIYNELRDKWINASAASGQVDGISASDGAVTANLLVSGQVDAVSGAEGILVGVADYPVSGQVDAVSGTEGTVVGSTDYPVDGQVDGTSGTDGTLTTRTLVDGQVDAVSGASGAIFITGASTSAELLGGGTIEVSSVTLANVVTMTDVTLEGGGTIAVDTVQPVVPMTDVTLLGGGTLTARPDVTNAPDPRTGGDQWCYRITELDGTPLGELVDIEHDPVEDAVGEPATMSFTIAMDDAARSLIKPIERQLCVWQGETLRLRGPILPGSPSEDGTTITHKVHDPSWYWRDGRRIITRVPQLNLLRNGDFRQGLNYWTRGYDTGSIPAAPPTVTIVDEDFVNDSDNINPIKAAEIVGVETVTMHESEVQSSPVFWPNRPFAYEPLSAGFRPGGAAIIDAVATAMPTTPGLKVKIVGHTANDGTGNGLALSLRRAQAAAARVAAIRPSAVITTQGVGFYQPKPGFPIDSQEQRRVVISYESTVTVSAKSKQWIRQTVSVTQPKAARYPLELTAAAMLKVADDWSVEDANMIAVRVVARRPGKATPWNAQLGEASTSISDTDPVDRWLGETATVTVPADDRLYYVDVYLYAPAALARYTAVGLFPQEQLYFWGVDQALIAKGVVEHMQSTAMGHGNLNVGTRMPLTGIKRDKTWAFRDVTPVDTALDWFPSLAHGMDIDTLTTHDAVTVASFYPRLGQVLDYVLALGGNVARAVPATTSDVGSSIIVQAQDIGSYRGVAYARDAAAFGGTLLERVITAEQDTPLNELDETAAAELAMAKVSTTAYWLDIEPEFIGEVLAQTGKGDTCRLILDGPDEVDSLARIVKRQNHPDGLRLMVALEA